MNRNPFVALVFTFLICAWLPAGCGGEEPSPEPTAAPPAALPATTVTDQSAAGSSPGAADLPPAGTTTPAAATQTPASTAVMPAVTGEITSTMTATATTAITPCAQPPGWFAYDIQSGDTLTVLSIRSGVTPDVLARANCLEDDTIIAGRALWLPVDLRLTPTPCAIPAGWIAYTVIANDTLSELEALTGATVEEIQRANCLPDTVIVEGRTLYLPVAPMRRTPATPVPAAQVSAGTAGAAGTDTFLAAPPAPAPAGESINAGGEGETTISSAPPEVASRGGPVSPFSWLTSAAGIGLEAPDPAPTIVKCPNNDTTFRVLDLRPTQVSEVGEILAFYACNPLKTDGPFTAIVSHAGSRQAWEVAMDPLPPGSEPGTNYAQALAIWYARPQLPTGDYEIVIKDGGGNQTDAWPFTINKPTNRQHILTVPATGIVGKTIFTIYLINYPPGCHEIAIQAVELDPDDPLVDCIAEETQARAPFCIGVNHRTTGMNWGSYSFTSAATDPPGCYGLNGVEGSADGSIVVLLP